MAFLGSNRGESEVLPVLLLPRNWRYLTIFEQSLTHCASLLSILSGRRRWLQGRPGQLRRDAKGAKAGGGEAWFGTSELAP